MLTINNNFKKRFTVGLTTNTTVQEFENFVHEYKDYINRIFFSVPLGDRFHDRISISKRLNSIEGIEFYWKLVMVILKYDIDTELCLNTRFLTKKDIEDAAILLEKYNINIKHVTILDKYYDAVKEYFPNSKLTLSFNQFANKESIRSIKNIYDTYVVGGCNIREWNFYEYVNRNNREITLLLNNGCSHVCGGCRTYDYCEEVFKKSLKLNSPSKLYALQSIMPFELNLIENRYNIDNFKVSSRDADIKYIRNTIDSYINQNEKLDIEYDLESYLLWCRLTWFIKYYSELDFDYIVKEKYALYQ